MQKHAHRRELAFDAGTFEFLCKRYLETKARGEDPLERNRLKVMPEPLFSRERGPLVDRLVERGEEALRSGRVGVVVLNGGMAMRFGGGAKGVERLVDDSPHSFLSLRLAQLAQISRRLETEIPVAVMHSFATQSASEAHLNTIQWAGLSEAARTSFVQGVLPRIALSGEPLFELPIAKEWPNTSLFSAPGHGDTWASLQRSGVLAAWIARGVCDILICNVDNIGATLDPAILGAHLAAVEDGAELSVEVVEREPGDAGGWVARVEGRPTIVEGFRMPAAAALDSFRAFNTNTLWFRADALSRPSELHWFDVHRALVTPDGQSLPIVQFEQLIGQATDFLETHVLSVDRATRFIPIKTRDDLRRASAQISERIASLENRG